MSAKNFTGLAILFFLFTCIHKPITAYSNPTYKQSIETQLLQIQQDSNTKPDLLENLLMVSKHWQPSLNLAILREEIERLTFLAKQKLTKHHKPEDIIQILRTLIHNTESYEYTDQVDEKGVPVNSEELFLHGLLKTHKGYCMNLSLLYLILGQKLELPLYGVALPNHFFVRYEQEDVRINIETTERGVSYPDSFYEQRFRTQADNQSSYFLKNLNGRQTLGAYFSNIGMVYYQSQRQERALFYMNLSTSINPMSIDAQNNLANIYSELKKPHDAIKHYNLALKANPNNTATLFNLGLVFIETGDYIKAINTLLKVTQIDPRFSPAHQMLANLYLQEKRLTSALLHLKILARTQPENLQNHLNIASTYGRMGQQALALETLKKVKTKFPNTLKIHEGMAEAYYRLEDFKLAIEQYRFLIDQDQTHLSNYIQLGWTYYRINDLPMASAWTLRGMKKSKEAGQLKALAQMNLGFYSLLQKQYKKARKWYETVLSENPPNISKGMIQDINEIRHSKRRADLHFFKGWIYFKSNQPKNAQASLLAYLQMDENGPFSEESRSILKQLVFGDNKVKRILNKNNLIEPEPDMALVPSGFFKMGSSKTLDDESPEHRVYLDGYWIDKYEVSAGKFAKFLNAVDNIKGYYLDNKFGTLFYDGRYHPRPSLENYPINNVSWLAADSYCKWKGKRLPTEAEWEKAARGELGQVYPWGNLAPSDTRARYFKTWTEEEKHKVMMPVHALIEGQSPYGLHNMAGNVKEWVDDWYDREYYKEQSEYANPRGPIGGEFKGVRGGSWRDLKGFIYSSFRNNGNPQSRMDDYGFRCAKNATPTSDEKKLTSRAVPRNKG